MTEPDERREIHCRVTAKVDVEVWIQHGPSDLYGSQHETRKLEVSLSEQLDSSADIREAFGRLAEIAVQGATR